MPKITGTNRFFVKMIRAYLGEDIMQDWTAKPGATSAQTYTRLEDYLKNNGVTMDISYMDYHQVKIIITLTP